MNVYLLDIASVSEQDVSDYARILDADRQTRIAQYARSADKRRSFGVGMALLYAWRMQYGDRIMPRTARDENGRPYFIGETISFGLSHSGHYAACVLAEGPNKKLGLDIQEPRMVRAAVTARFFSEGEQRQIRAGSDPCLIWSRKESLAKYRGSGLRGDLRLLDTADDAQCRGASQSAEGALCRELCQSADDVQCREPSRMAVGAPCRDSGQTADDRAHIWSCRTADGYAVSVCAGEDTACRLTYLTWEQIKDIL